jgi:hypothetical protein
MKTYRIDRTKWLRGTSFGTLWSKPDQAGCCLGHMIKQDNDCTWDELANKSYPSLSDISEGVVPDVVKFGCEVKFSIQASKFAGINDNPCISDELREAQLISLAKENGFNIEFYN